MPFPLPKLELVGIPGFAGGGMENWGLITFDPSKLYVKPGSSDQKNRRFVGNPSGKPVRHVMSSWTKQAGFPLIFATLKNQMLELKQAKFISPNSNGNGYWTVPITPCCDSYETCHSFLFSKKSASFDLNQFVGCSCTPNSLQSGNQVANEGVLDDINALTFTHQLPFTNLLTFVDAFSEDTNYREIASLLEITKKAVTIAADATPKLFICIKKIFIRLFENIFLELGWNTKPNEAKWHGILRSIVLTMLAVLGPEATIKEATGRALPSCPDARIILEALNLLVADGVATGDVNYGISNLSWEGHETAWTWLKDNWDTLSETIDSIDNVISKIVSPFTTVEKAAEVKAFFASQTRASITEAVDSAVQQVIRANAAAINLEATLNTTLQLASQALHRVSVKMGFGRRQSICWAVLLVFSCFELTLGNPVPEDYGTGAENFTGQLQLPKFAVPSRYELRLKPDLVDFTFSGSVNIELDIVSETKFLVYNAVELTILLGDISFNSSKSDKVFKPLRSWQFGEEDQIMVLEFDENLPIGSGVLSISNFQGILNDELRGFYRSYYFVNGEKRYMAVTQFEPLDARRCFPCWDEPALKAKFQITLDVPSDLMALSNMPILDEKIDGNLKTVSYQESPVMSTYLVAVVVGLFDYVENHTSNGAKVRVYCPVGKSDTGTFALDVAVKSLEIYKQFFGFPYALPKLDLIGIPQFAAGAMENWGLVTFRPELLYTKPEFRNLQAAGVIAHELGHQWTGDLVTMEWWTHLWLNEGFATWLSSYALSRMFPDSKTWFLFTKSTAGILRVDALPTSHPIEIPIHNTSEIEGIFDGITYDKGAAVLRMLQTYLGPRVFQRSLAAYVKRYSWSNANTEDLWTVLAKVSGKPVRQVMSPWTKQAGFPLIFAKVHNQKLELKQTQFLSTGSHGNGLWTVPITLCCGSYRTCHSFLLNKKSENVLAGSLPSCPDAQIVLEALNFLISPEVSGKNAFVQVYNLRPQGRETAWLWLQDNWDTILNIFDVGVGPVIKNIVSAFASVEKASEVRAFFASRTLPSFADMLEQSIQQILKNSRWVHNIQKEKNLAEVVQQLSHGNC
uniref:Alpha-aminoacylpeptide hydrolase n=1 Tax=Kalanchoe fedtschenkoi TaxID=63787 RepID=A0A7N1A7K8_KALFE